MVDWWCYVKPRSGVDHKGRRSGQIDTADEEALSLDHLSGQGCELRPLSVKSGDGGNV